MAEMNPNKLSALVLDDHSLIREILRSHLETMKFREIFLAKTAKEAELLIKKNRPDIVFVDWVLPGESGFKMLQDFRADPGFNTTAFIMVTAQNEVEKMTDAMMAGATSYIVKPIIQSDFINIVEVALEWLEKARTKNTTS